MAGKCGMAIVGFFDDSKWPDPFLAKNISCRIHLKSSFLEVSIHVCLGLSIRRAANWQVLHPTRQCGLAKPRDS